MRAAARFAVAAFAVLLAGACRGPDAIPADRPSADPQSHAALVDPLEIVLPPLRWEPAPARTGGRRAALLVAVNEYAEPNWNLPFALPSVGRLRDALVASGAFAADDVVVKSDDGATRDVIRAQIDRLARSMEGPDNALLVHWVGHGFNIDGEQRFLTWASRHDGNGYADTIAYGELALWLDDARRAVAERGGELRTALVVDACRTRDQNAPGRLRAHRPLVDVEAFSAAPGSPATARPTEDVTVFTAAFAEGLRRDGLDRDVSLLTALREGVLAAESQGAMITTGDSDLVLLDADDLSVVVRAVDAATGEQIPDARVQLNGVEQGGTAVFRELAETAEGYDLLVRAPGYFWRSHSLHLDRERAGAMVSVPLRREFVVVQGRIELRDGGVARVALTGAFDGLRDGEHETSRTLTTSSGFRLRVPFTPGARSLVVERDGREVRRKPIDLAELPSTLMDSGGTRVRVFDVGAFVIEGDERGALTGGGTVAAQVGGVDLAFDFDSVRDTDFTDASGASFFAEVRRLVDRGEYQQAAQDLAALLDNKRVRGSGRYRLGKLQEELALADLLGRAERLQAQGDLAAARDLLDASPLREHEKVVPLLLSWFDVAAREAQERGDAATAASRLASAMELARGREKFALRKRLQAVQLDALDAAYEQALSDGSWPALDPLIEALRRAGGYTAATEWRARVKRESIPPRCRAHHQAGVAAQADGDLEAAHTEYGRALEAQPNEHYRELLVELRRELGQKLFQRYNAIAAEAYNGGDLRAALEAYMRAFEFDALVTSRILSLVRDEQLRAEEPELVARAEALMAGAD